MNKILLVEPQSKEDHVYKHVRMPRLGLPILATQLKNKGYDVEIYMGTADSLPMEKLLAADLVGISTTTATCREAYQIAGLLRTNNIPVVIGGIHATFLPEEALKFADYVVRGEAEETFLPLIQSIEENKLKHDIPGISYWCNGEEIHNPGSEIKIDMDSFPIPDLSLFNGHSKLRTIPVMTSRGCPFSCTFCCVTEMFGRRYRHRCTESVLQELERYEGKNIFFCDDNFTANPGLTKELLRGIIDRGIKLNRWGAQVRVDAARDEELLSLMKLSGCGIVYIGFESINPETLKDFQKQQTIEDIEKAINCFHNHGIRIHGMFVFGGEADTVDTIRQTKDFALQNRIDSIQFMTLTPFPGTAFYDKLEKEGRILTRDWSLYDGHHTVFQPALIPAEELQLESVKALKKFYSFRNIFLNVPLTGWATAIHRTIGWILTRHFERRNRWYYKLLKQNKTPAEKPIALFYRLFRGTDYPRMDLNVAKSHLKISISEQKGILYLKLRGLINSLQIKDLKRSLNGPLTKQYSQLVINMEGLGFVSEKTAGRFWSYIERLASRVRRLQVIVIPDKHSFAFFVNEKRKKKLPPIEVVFQKR
ncbi:MAG: radical SAM protein [Bacillota bacterium]|nr:radical SAM protein [Bacillota bacterium]